MIVAGLILAVAIQTATPGSPQTPSPQPSDDIVVTDLRDINDPKSPVTHQTLGSSRTGLGAMRSRQMFELAERFARCAVRRNGRGMAELRGALDDTTYSARQLFNQKRFVQLNATCAQDAGLAQVEGIAAVLNGFPPYYYDRGAIVLQSLRVFAPELRLTKKETADPAVQSRFNLREVPRARFRLPADRTYFETAVCLVRLQPELSVRLAQTSDYEDIPRLEAAIVNGARVCTSNARKVYFDPIQFRFYIADAVYRWALAAEGKDSFIPQP